MNKQAEHLLVLPLPLRRGSAGELLIEQQAANGVDRWAEHFSSLLVACPLMPESVAGKLKNLAWRDVKTIPSVGRIEFVPLPWATSRLSHLRHYRATAKVLRELIERSHYLQFGLAGLYGDWAGLATRIARKMGRAYALHIDCVDEEFVVRTARDKPLLKRLKARAFAMALKRWHYPAIESAALCLCHGLDVYEAYKGMCAKSFVIHNVHTSKADLITSQQLEAKLKRIEYGAKPKVVYAGRMEAEKAPVDWVRSLAHAREQGAEFEATWVGHGSMKDEVEALVRELKLEGWIKLPGFTSDRAAVLRAMREADVFLFTHITRESPRCLLESLITGTPIVGYTSAFAQDLISGHGGGVLTPLSEPAKLGHALAGLLRDRWKLQELVRAAASDGAAFTSEAVFAHRAELIKAHLPPFSGGGEYPGGRSHEAARGHRELPHAGTDDRVPAVPRR